MTQKKITKKQYEFNGITFDSAPEMARYVELLNDETITDIQVHPKYLLLSKRSDERAVSYTADFSYLKNGNAVVEDVKSRYTSKFPDYILKRKMFKYFYPDIIFNEHIK